ncbi:Dot/Icm system substrate protein LidA [Legionella birminghamensis]|uniref:Dot/Icm system substrate protein LidA n=1 Tax=Legionella birminghamensis TaxID=28083 RepID=A0A378IEL1_9GAMM|nr:hypothetical protein [Legionella birminghamensis]KTC68883.1 Dot/Icm system substrate protein LidA [Legionella birminghamensis]STX33175.1 Dot/Icm system substrate protein LidA [Legionella birminghamensis]
MSGSAPSSSTETAESTPTSTPTSAPQSSAPAPAPATTAAPAAAKATMAPVAPAKTAAATKESTPPPAEDDYFFKQSIDQNDEPWLKMVKEWLNLINELNAQFTDFAGEKLKGVAQGAQAVGSQAFDAVKNYFNPPKPQDDLMRRTARLETASKPTRDEGLDLDGSELTGEAKPKPAPGLNLSEMSTVYESPEDIVGSSFLYNPELQLEADEPLDVGASAAPKIDQDSVMLHDSDQQITVELTAVKLQNWLNKVDGTQTSETDNPSITLGKTGLQKARDVINFLNTPAGDTTKERIATELIQAVEREKQNEEIQREQLLQEQRLAAFLIHAARQDADLIAERNIRIQEDIDQRVQVQKQQQLADSMSPDEKAQKEADLDAMIGAYDEQIESLQKAIAEKDKEIAEVDKEIERLEQKGKSIDAKHNTYQDGVNRAKSFNPDNPDDRAAMRSRIGAMRAEAEKNEQSAFERVDRDEDGALEDLQKAKNNIMEIAALEEMLDVYEGKQTAYTADGTQTSNPDEFAYLAPSNKSILKDDAGNLYLVNKGVASVDSLSTGEKQQAQADFQRNKNAMTSVQDVIKNNRSGEHGMNNQSLDAAQQKKQSLMSESAEMRMQLQTALKEKEKCQDAKNNLRSPSPSPASGNQQLSKAEIDQATSVFYKMLNRVADNYSDGGMKALQNHVVNTFGQNQQTNALLRQIPQGQPIDPNNIRQLTEQFRSCGDAPAPSMQASAEAEQQNQQTVRMP